MASEAQRNACLRYYYKNKHRKRTVAIRLDIASEADVLGKLDSVPNKTKYICGLVREDIERGSNG